MYDIAYLENFLLCFGPNTLFFWRIIRIKDLWQYREFFFVFFRRNSVKTGAIANMITVLRF